MNNNQLDNIFSRYGIICRRAASLWETVFEVSISETIKLFWWIIKYKPGPPRFAQSTILVISPSYLTNKILTKSSAWKY